MSILVIIRGFPNTGSDDLVKLLVKTQQDLLIYEPMVCRAGDFRGNEWTPESLHIAKIRCQELTRDAMQKNIRYIVAEDTNIVYKDMKPYFEMAKEFRYDVWCVESPKINMSVDQLFARSTYIPLSTLQKMKRRFATNKELSKIVRKNFPNVKFQFLGHEWSTIK